MGFVERGADTKEKAKRTGDCSEEEAKVLAGSSDFVDDEMKAREPSKAETRAAPKLQEEREENNRQVIELADKILANVNPEKLLLGLGCRQDKNDQTSSKQ